MEERDVQLPKAPKDCDEERLASVDGVSPWHLSRMHAQAVEQT